MSDEDNEIHPWTFKWELGKKKSLMALKKFQGMTFSDAMRAICEKEIASYAKGTLKKLTSDGLDTELSRSTILENYWDFKIGKFLARELYIYCDDYSKLLRSDNNFVEICRLIHVKNAEVKILLPHRFNEGFSEIEANLYGFFAEDIQRQHFPFRRIQISRCGLDNTLPAFFFRSIGENVLHEVYSFGLARGRDSQMAVHLENYGDRLWYWQNKHLFEAAFDRESTRLILDLHNP